MNYEIKKRLLDLVVAGGLLITFLPFWIFIPILIFFDSGLPIIFRHKRVGKDGKEFMILKFRSMVPNAHKILHEENPELLEKFKNGDWKVKAEEDPRITPLGRFLRAFTIDEFPQIFNVLKGDMSMVGPRAYMQEELDDQTKKYPDTEELVPIILSVKPGVTGVWQTSGRNEIPFNQRAQLDAAYAQHRSIWQDIQIILRTPKAMLSKW